MLQFTIKPRTKNSLPPEACARIKPRANSSGHSRSFDLTTLLWATKGPWLGYPSIVQKALYFSKLKSVINRRWEC